MLSLTSTPAPLMCSRNPEVLHKYLTHSIYNFKSLFSSLAEMLGSFTTEKRDVSSTKSLTMEVFFSDKNIKKNRGPKMNPFSTPTLTGNQFDGCPLSVTCWNL